MSDQILSVKLIKKGEKVEVKLGSTGLINSENSILCKDACHPDLYNAVQAIKSHLALLTNYIPIGGDLSAVALAPFEVTGYALNNKQDGVTLKGYRETDLGRTITLNVLVKFKQDEANGYPIINDLEAKLQKIVSETNKYRLEGKTLQTKMDFDEKEGIVTHAQIAEPDANGNLLTKQEWTAQEYTAEVNHTADLRDQGKVVPIKKGKKAKEPVVEKEYTPAELEARKVNKRNPNKTAAK